MTKSELKKFRIMFFAIALAISICIGLVIGFIMNQFNYNYSNDYFKCQYDKSQLMISNAENNASDVFIHTNDDYYAAYIDVAKIEGDYGTSETTLTYMRLYLMGIVGGGELTDIKTRSTTQYFGHKQALVEEYNYVIEGNDDTTSIVRSKLITVGDDRYMVVEKYYKDAYGEDTINALDLAYNSIYIK